MNDVNDGSSGFVGFRESLSKFEMLSELYAGEASDAMLLPEYPSSNSTETNFRNSERWVIHDPFPPPKRSLIKVLGPHHLMCGWGDRLPVTSEVSPPSILVDHWRRTFGTAGCPNWRAWTDDLQAQADSFQNLITLYPHESLQANQHVVDPDALHRLHSKEVIERINCAQAKVLGHSLADIRPPCLVKLSHGYAGLGNYFVHNQDDVQRVKKEINTRWPQARIVVNEILPDIVGDYGVQFFLGKSGTVTCLGLTEQKFNDDFDSTKKWSGGHFQADRQDVLLNKFRPIIESAAAYLHRHNYFGVVGVDVLVNRSGESFLVDVNPRLTGITPFLIASRIFLGQGKFTAGIYRASFKFAGCGQQLIKLADRHNQLDETRVLVLAIFEQPDTTGTSCHVSVSGRSIDECQSELDELDANTKRG